MTADRCESCGRLEDDLLKVQRIYLLPADDPGVQPVTEDADLVPSPGDIELWCASCRGTFPHTVLVPEQ
jgi:hypothetical protein